MSQSTNPPFGLSSAVQSESIIATGKGNNVKNSFSAPENSDSSSTNAVLRGDSESSGTSNGEYGVTKASSPQNSSWTFGVSCPTSGTSVPGFGSSATPTFSNFSSVYAGFGPSSSGMLGSSSTFWGVNDEKQPSPFLFGCTCGSFQVGLTCCNNSAGALGSTPATLFSALTIGGSSPAPGISLPNYQASSTPIFVSSSSASTASFGQSISAQSDSKTTSGQANKSNGNVSTSELVDTSSTYAVLKWDSKINGNPAGEIGETLAYPFQNSTLASGSLKSSSSASAIASSPMLGNATASFGAFGQTNNQNSNLYAPISFGCTSTSGSHTCKSPCYASSTGVFEANQSSPLGNSMTAFGTSTTAGSIFGQKAAFGSFASLDTSNRPAFSSARTSFIFGRKQGFGSSASLSTSSQPAFAAARTSSTGTTHTVLGTTYSFSCETTKTFTFGSTGAASGSSHAPAFGSAEALHATGFSSSSNPVPGSPSGFKFGAASTSVYFSVPTPSLGQSTSAPNNASQFQTFPPAFGTWSYSFGARTSKAFGSNKDGDGKHGGSRVLAYTATTNGNGCTCPSEKLVSISAMPAYINRSPEELRWEDYQQANKGICFNGSTFGFSGFGASSAPHVTSSPNVDHTAKTLSTTHVFPSFRAFNAPAIGSSPSIVNNSLALGAVPALASLNFANTPPLPLFWPIAPSLGQSNVAFGQCPNFGQSIIARAPEPPIGFGQNAYSSIRQLHSPGNSFGFGQANSSLSSPLPAGFCSHGNFVQTPGRNFEGGYSSSVPLIHTIANRSAHSFSIYLIHVLGAASTGTNGLQSISGVPVESTHSQHSSLPTCTVYFPPCQMVWFT
ncbi:Nuclear pore complex protein like [Actinidia chinensis var. chinensis]|uniref:Nuclear pore complex protein like n=1 Tax=Actinidia chinensis var. chinensis TaxID=1590841 RepID=A0A2R6Q6U2_ACTCC|nr:Nuclear pore complex protein like [Actinidia chinensis var. chinensis]